MQALARQGYTAAQVEAVLRAGTGTIGTRFELLDPNMRVVGNLDAVPAGVQATTPGSVLAATVDFDVDRPLVGALDLTMLPDARLRDTPFQYRIKPWLQFGPMPDGKVVEFPMGVYVWAVPERDIAPGIEEWNVTLADGLYDYDSTGPDVGGFQAWTGERQTDALVRIANTVGYSDTSGIRTSDAVFSGPRSWGLTRPKQAFGITYLPAWEQGWGFYSNGDMISVGGENPNQTRTTTFLDIASEIHHGIGYETPWMNFDGVPQARPAVDWSKATAATTFGTAADGITISPIHTANDLSKFCNRVQCWSESGDAALFFAEADANIVVPGHPLSQAKIRRYATKYDTQSTADSQTTGEQLARRELLEGLSTYQKVTYTTLFWPVEPYDINGVMVAGDAEFATAQLFQERAASFDLFTGEVRHAANRVFSVTSPAGST